MSQSYGGHKFVLNLDLRSAKHSQGSAARAEGQLFVRRCASQMENNAAGEDAEENP